MPVKIYRRGQIWHFRGTVAGRRLRGSTGTTDKDIAARVAAEAEGREWKCSLDGSAAVLTFAQAAIMYRAAGKPTRFLDKVEDYWRDTLVKDIKPAAIKKMAIEIYPNVTPATRNRQAIVPCQAIINFAAEAELCPAVKVKRFKVTKKIKPAFTLEWVEQFCAHASPHLAALALFMFATGARISEALAVEWQHVDLNRGTALIPKTKIGEQRQVNLPRRLTVAIANLPKIDDRPVFFYRKRGDMHNLWDKTIERAGLQRMTPHSGRHGFATTILRSGVDPKTGAWLGGWKSIKHFMETYAHAIEDITLNDRVFDAPVTQPKPRHAKRSVKTGLK